MRAITVRQPWAQAIVSGVKTIENRSRNIAGSYRGPLLIHAGAQWDRTAFDHPELAAWLAAQWHITRNNWTGTSLPTGQILGTVNLTDVHLDGDGWICSPWSLPGHHHLCLADARQLPDRVPAKGALGLWTPPDDVLSLIAVGIARGEA